MNSRISLNQVWYGKYPALFFINSVVGIFGTIFISMGLGQIGELLDFLGKNTLVILSLHNIVIAVFIKTYKVIFKTEFTGFSIFEALFFCELVLATCAVPALIVNRFFPWMIGKKISEKASKDI